MMVMTTKVDIKKIGIILAAVVAVILAIVLIFGGRNDTAASTTTVSGNDARVKFLTDFGWQVSTSPTESGQVRIPEQQTEVFSRYNALQKSQGYDLSQYAGKAVMRYVYKVNNFPGATEPVYATLLVYKNQIIGGDITNTAAKGIMQGFKKQENAQPQVTAPTEATVPATT
jgi:hypothetical protein